MKALLKTVNNQLEVQGAKDAIREHYSRMHIDPSMYRDDNVPKEVIPTYDFHEYHFSASHVIDVVFLKYDYQTKPDLLIDFGHKQMLVQYSEDLATKLRMTISGI